MYINFFYLLFVLAVGSFSVIFISNEQDTKLIFSVLSVILFAALALGSFGLELINVVVVGTTITENITVVYSPSFAYVCLIFGSISLISSINITLGFLRGTQKNESI